MKMLYPRKIDEVLWHSTTFFCLKSIFVYIPRLPTIRVMGSQAISTTPVSSAVVIALPSLRGRGSPALLVAGEQFVALLTPLRLLVGRLRREAPQRPDHRSVERARGCGHPRSRRFVHERHELVREPWHRAGDADPADVGTGAH